MSFARPSLADLIARAETDIETGMDGADARLRRAFLNVAARVVGGAAHGLYGFIAWIFKQVFPDTAEAEFLERWAGVWGVVRKAATQATGDITFVGTDGATIPAGSVLRRADGVEYETLADATTAAGTATAAVRASLAGSAGNAASGVKLNLVSPIAGVQSQATVAAAGLTAGADIESDDSLRARLLGRIQEPPHGGASGDYLAWAREVAGVTRAWVYPTEQGKGTVVVRFVMDDKAGTIIPSAGEVQAVQDYIDERRPVTAEVFVVAPVPVALDFTISLTPATVAVKAAVEAELRDLLRRDAEPGGTILLSRIREAVSIAAGESDNAVTIPAADVAHATGEIAVFGAITWA